LGEADIQLRSVGIQYGQAVVKNCVVDISHC
jgi:hypothetical protein